MRTHGQVAQVPVSDRQVDDGFSVSTLGLQVVAAVLSGVWPHGE